MKGIDLQAAWDELQGLDWKNIGAWSQWVYYFFCVLAAVTIFFGAYYFSWAPELETLHGAQRQEQQLKHDFQAKAAKAAALPLYKTQLEQMKKDFGSMLQQLPGQSEIANLLNDISQARVAAGLKEELFQPQPEIIKDFYAVVPNQIIVTGSFEQMADFVSAVAALSRIVTIDSVDLKLAGDKAAPYELRMSALAKTYRYLSEAETQKAAKDAKAGRKRR